MTAAVSPSVRYRVQRLIKRGGMAEVFEGVAQKDGQVSRRVALKLLHQRQSPNDLIAFADEARLAAMLDHPNIVSVFDHGTIDGQPFQAMELVSGLDLKELQELGELRSLPLPVEAALFIVGQIARALEYAHRAVDGDGKPLGIVHRDVTPHNVLVSWSGHVKLVDFGIARCEGRHAVTEPGIVKGKLSFIAPEYLAGGPASPLADVFGLGCVLHFALTGSSPYAAEDAQGLVAYRTPPQFDRALSDDVLGLVEWACHPTPASRCPSASDFAVAAERALIQRSGSADATALVWWLERVHARRTPTPAHRLIEMFELEPSGLDPDSRLQRFNSTRAAPVPGTSPFRNADWLADAISTVPSPVVDRPSSGADPALPTVEDNAGDGIDFVCTEVEGAPLPTPLAWKAVTGPATEVGAWLSTDDLGRYVVLAELRPAGRGQLLLARPRASMPGRPKVIVLKVWPPDMSENLTFASLLTREATLRRQMPNPHLPAVYDLGVSDDRLFVEMEYTLGRTLQQVLDGARRPLEAEDVAAIGAGMARGLSAARDIRDALGSDFDSVPCAVGPEHVFITFDGRVLLTDFDSLSAAERLISAPDTHMRVDGARRRELRALVNTLQAMLQESSDQRAQTLRRRMAEVSDRGPGAGLATMLDALVKEPQRRLHALMMSRFAGDFEMESEVLNRLQGHVDEALDPEPEVVHTECRSDTVTPPMAVVAAPLVDGGQHASAQHGLEPTRDILGYCSPTRVVAASSPLLPLRFIAGALGVCAVIVAGLLMTHSTPTAAPRTRAEPSPVVSSPPEDGQADVRRRPKASRQRVEVRPRGERVNAGSARSRSTPARRRRQGP